VKAEISSKEQEEEELEIVLRQKPLVFVSFMAGVFCSLTTCLENLEMPGNFTDVREMSQISVKTRNLGQSPTRVHPVL